MVLSRPRLRRAGARRRRPDLRPPTSNVAATARLPAATSTPPAPASPRLPASSATDAAVGTSSRVAVLSPSRSCCSSPAVLVEATVGLGSRRHVLWSSLADEDDDSEEEELAPLTPSATKSLSRDVQPAQPSVAREADTGVGWQEVLPRRGPRRPASSVQALPPRPIPAWLFGRCCRCLAHGHRAAVCRDPLRCSRCLENGHRRRECHNPWRPLSSLACLAAPPRSGADHGRAPASCEGLRGSALPAKALRPGSWASVVCAPSGSVAPSDVMLQSALAAKYEQLQVCLARVESFVERAESALGKLSQSPPVLQNGSSELRPLIVTDVGLTDMEGSGLHGSFSPTARASSSVMAPLMQMMPELVELCGEPVLSLFGEQVKTVSPEMSDVASPPSQALDFEESGVVQGAVSLSRVSVPVGDVVDTSGPLPRVLGSLVPKEICDFFATLAAANPGSVKTIGCLLKEKASRDKTKRSSVKEKSKCRSKKGGATGNAPEVA